MAEGGEGDTKYCSNCKRDIASSNFVMHEIHCRRHIVLCEHCQEPVPRSDLDDHFNEFHAKIMCQLCKMSVSKDSLKSHMENSCPMKPMKCEFCELSFPQLEIESHIEYCGSRTEQCPSCQQYIMLKGMTRHENSMCTYPEPKPAPPSTDYSNPFSMEDFQYLLNQEFSSIQDSFSVTDNFPEFDSNLRQELARSKRSLPTRKTSNSSQKVSNEDNRRLENGAKKKSDNISKAKNLTPSTLGVDNSKNSTSPLSLLPDIDYDTMLALQMAHEDWQGEQDTISPTEADESSETWHNGSNSYGITELLNHVRETNNVNLAPSSASQSVKRQQSEQASNVYSDEDMIIPCEFCEMEVPLNNYLSHVENCPFSGNVQDNRYNNPHIPDPQTRPAIPVINNLHTNESLVRSVNDDPFYTNDLDEQFVLPCEFCMEVFPADIIFEHQNVCLANGMVTPRSTTPASNLRPTSVASNRIKTKKTPKTHSNNSSLLDFIDNNNLDNSSQRSNDNFFPLHKSSIDSPTDKYLPGLNRFDDAVTRPPRRQQQNRLSESETPKNLATTRPSKSAQRARARLNQLLEEENLDAASVSAVSNRRKTSRSDADKNTPGNRRDSRTQTQVNSRTVMRQLERTGQRESTRNRSGATGASGTRSRQRADYVFSPEIRLKPPPNPKK